MFDFLAVPFAPPWEDLQQTKETRHATCYIFNTTGREASPEAKVRADAAMVKAYQEAQRMIRLMERNAELSGTEG